MNKLFFLPHYPSFCWPWIFGILLDQAEVMAKNNDVRVTIIHCDSCETIGKCFHLHLHPKRICRLCNFHKQYLLKKLSKNIQLISLSDLAKDMRKEDRPSFQYNTLEELKNLNYKNIDIGYASFSTYLSFAVRNLNPLIDEPFKKFIDQYLDRCCGLADIFEYALEKYAPDHVCFFNARLIDSKPLLDICLHKKISFTSLENRLVIGNQPRITFFHNTTPFDIENYNCFVKKQWDSSSLSEEERIKTASVFYTNRRNSVAAGDKVYTKNQQSGLLPDNLDTNKHNIVIFNSSEDEFASVGKAYGAKRLFPSQLDGLQTIFELFKDNADIYFYLRIHPNLANIHYLFHHILYDFDKRFPNVTVIPPDSLVSTYSLIDAANKVIVFGSTTGAEAVFWGKPAILLDNSAYQYLDICYIPRNIDEIKELILNYNLPVKNKLGALQFAYDLLNTESGEFEFFKTTKREYHFFKRPVRIQYFEIKGSKFAKYRTTISQFFCKLIYELTPKMEIPDKEDEKAYQKYRFI